MTTTPIPTGPTSILDILEEPNVLEYLCCICLEPRDVLNLKTVSKRAGYLIDHNTRVWYNFALTYAGKELPSTIPSGLSPKEIFLLLFSPDK